MIDPTESLIKAINDLIEGNGKDNLGSLHKYFDERDKDLERLSVKELEDMKEWMHVIIS